VTPAISVVLPVRNGERFLREAVDSVLAQTFEDFELIVVDDGSSDSTPSIVRGYDDPRLRLLERPPEGLVPALNAGLAAARAPLIARMDADDVSAPGRLERQRSRIEASPSYGMVATWSQVLDEHGQEVRVEVLPLDPGDLARRLLLRNPFRHGSTLLRKEAVDGVDGYRDEYGHSEDYDLWARLVRAGWSLAVVPEVLYGYREHRDAITRTDPDRVRLRERLRDELWATLREPYPIRAVVRNGRRYRREHSSLGAQVWRDHVADQRALVREAARRGRPLLAAKALMAAALLGRYPRASVS
jgi:glycosyltransferase involved in cell wall biosynthesis